MRQLSKETVYKFEEGVWLKAQANDNVYIGYLSFYDNEPMFIKIIGNIKMTGWFIRDFQNYFVINKDEAMLLMLEH